MEARLKSAVETISCDGARPMPRRRHLVFKRPEVMPRLLTSIRGVLMAVAIPGHVARA